MKEKKLFAILPESVIDRAKWEGAHKSLAVARKDLRLPPIKLKWFCEISEAHTLFGVQNPETVEFEEEPGQPLGGVFLRADPESIYISALQDYRLSEIVYHETYHVRQKMSNSYASIEAEEKSAAEYADMMAKRKVLHGEDRDLFFRHLANEDWSDRPTSEMKPMEKHLAKRDENVQDMVRTIVMSAEVKKTFKRADAAADIELINNFSLEPLTPDDVFCFSVALCDNEVDRDNERFTSDALHELSTMFVGKTGISDHEWSARRQIARVYRTQVEKTKKTTRMGDPLERLIASAYIMTSKYNQHVIDAIRGGIMKEVSVGCAMGACNCSICGTSMKYTDPVFGDATCQNQHKKGVVYDGKLCIGELERPKDAYEFSFVAVPSQPGAGVTKGKGKTDLPKSFDQLPEDEQKARIRIIEENRGYSK